MPVTIIDIMPLGMNNISMMMSGADPKEWKSQKQQ